MNQDIPQFYVDIFLLTNAVNHLLDDFYCKSGPVVEKDLTNIWKPDISLRFCPLFDRIICKLNKDL